MTYDDPPVIEPRCVSLEETARALSLSVDSIRAMIDAGELHVIRWRRKVIVPVVEIDEWVETQRTGGMQRWRPNELQQQARAKVQRATNQ